MPASSPNPSAFSVDHQPPPIASPFHHLVSSNTHPPGMHVSPFVHGLVCLVSPSARQPIYLHSIWSSASPIISKSNHQSISVNANIITQSVCILCWSSASRSSASPSPAWAVGLSPLLDHSISIPYQPTFILQSACQPVGVRVHLSLCRSIIPSENWESHIEVVNQGVVCNLIWQPNRQSVHSTEQPPVCKYAVRQVAR